MMDEKVFVRQLAKIFRQLAQEIEKNPQFLGEIGFDLEEKKPTWGSDQLDIFKVLGEEGEEALKEKLASLELVDLKKLIVKHGFDPAKIAAKWRKKEKLVNFILEKMLEKEI